MVREGSGYSIGGDDGPNPNQGNFPLKEIARNSSISGKKMQKNKTGVNCSLWWTPRVYLGPDRKVHCRCREDHTALNN